MKPFKATQLMQWVIIGSADDPRVQGFIQALPPEQQRTAKVVSYCADWQIQLPSLLTSNTYLRIESPSHDLDAVRQLTRLGRAQADATGFAIYSDKDINNYDLSNGEFIAPHQFYFGLKQRLEGLQYLLKTHPIAGSMNHIPDVLTFYDKQVCHQQLSHHNVALPTALYDVTDYADLRNKMHEGKLRNVFIKTRFGSGASGIIALKTSGPLVHAQTTLEQDGKRLFNTRRLRLISNEGLLAELVDTLCHWGVHCEAWVPKAIVNKMNTDIRLLVVDGEANFAVLRKSKTPITNLHLLNQRASIEDLQSLMPQQAWQSVESTARKVAEIFPNSFHLALDVAVHKNFSEHSVLEINAFGDFLQNVTHQGMNSYQCELKQFFAKHSKSSISSTPSLNPEASL